MADESATQEAPQGPLVMPTKETRYLDANFMLGDPDDKGVRELTFVLGPTELVTFLIGPEASAFILKRLSGGIEIATPDMIPPTPKDE